MSSRSRSVTKFGDAVFSSLGFAWLTDRERTPSVSIDPVFASQKLSEEVDAWPDVPLFPDRSQALPEDGTQPNHSGNPNDDPMINYIWPGSNLLAD